jgi:hypothetical protein
MVKKSLKFTIFFFVPNSGKKEKEIAKKKDTAPNVRCKGAWVLDGRDALRGLAQEGEAL